MSEVIQNFLEAMAKAGCSPANPNDIQPNIDDQYYKLAGDKKGKRGAYCLTILPDGFAYGNFCNFKTGDRGKWNSSQNNRKLTKEEKEAFVNRIKQAEKDRESRQQKIFEQKSIEAIKEWESASPCKSHSYLTKKKVSAFGLKIKDDNIIIPMSSGGKIWSYQTISPDGEKLFLPGGKKKGCYFKLGKDGQDIGICEGVATGLSLYEALEIPIYIAFDAGNLEPVALEVSKLYPNSTIYIFGDSDQWSTNQKGELSNTGVIKGRQAAGKVDGFCITPEFPADDMDLRTDWNDYAVSNGVHAVKDFLMPLIENNRNKKPPEKEEPDDLYAREYEEPAIEENGDINLTPSMGLPFKVLGFNNGVYYYFPFGIQQIFGWSAAGHTMNNLLQLASLEEWQDWAADNYPIRLSNKEIPLYAFDKMKEIAVNKGVFQEEDRVRGCGAWMDAGRVVLHCGDRLLVDGVETLPRDIKGHYVYTAASQRFKCNVEPLSNKEAQKLREICMMPTWENPLSGLLLAGWLVTAPVCAALEWRPHIWITGEAGSGKTTLLTHLIKRVLNKISYNVDGGTSESSIREGLGYDARPIIYDEAEGHGNKTSLMDGVLGLAKLSSSSGYVGKRGQTRFIARSSFCFSAIYPPIKDFASETRISLLALKKNLDPNSRKHFENLMEAINDTLTPEYGRRMLARTVKYMPVLLANIQTFKKAATNIIKDARAADQVSAMLGGLYMLGSTGLISIQDAESWIKERDWTEHTAISEVTDQERLLHYISTSIVSVKSERGNKDLTIGTLIAACIGRSDELSSDLARSTLKQYSILARTDGIFIGNQNQNLKKILKDTEWVLNWNKTLARIYGAKHISLQYFNSGDKQRALRIPAELFYGDKIELKYTEEEEIPFD